MTVWKSYLGFWKKMGLFLGKGLYKVILFSKIGSMVSSLAKNCNAISPWAKDLYHCVNVQMALFCEVSVI